MSRIALSVLLVLATACSSNTEETSPPDAGIPDAGSPDAGRKYERFCDVSGPLIENYCTWFVDCQFEPDLDVQSCTSFYNTFIAWRCETPVTQTDEHIDKCLESFDSLECGRENFPPECEDVFFI